MQAVKKNCLSNLSILRGCVNTSTSQNLVTGCLLISENMFILNLFMLFRTFSFKRQVRDLTQYQYD